MKYSKSKREKLITYILFIIVFLIGILLTNTVYASNIDDYSSLDEGRYPGFKNVLQQLKNEHPSWNFSIYYTGLDWDDVITNEYQGHGRSPKNLSPANNSYYDGEWICPYCGRETYDSGSWYCASEAAIRYMMDPRNSMNSDDIFQFQNLSTSNISRDSVAAMVSGTFMDNDDCINAICEASKAHNINGYYLVARILQEQGTSGSVLSRGNGYNGEYQGVYNLFNIGAYGNGASNVIMNGLEYADDHGWDTMGKSIVGGAEFVARSYISIGQNTLYFQKFNVVTDNLFNHQYMQNILAAQNEGTKLRRTYANIDPDYSSEYTFLIPVYENMPATACSRPATSNYHSPNLKEATINANGGLKMRAMPGLSPEVIGYAVEGSTVKIVERATEQVDGYYWDKILTSGGVYGYVARGASDGSKVYLLVDGEENVIIPDNNKSGTPKPSTEEKIQIKDNCVVCSPKVTLSEIKEKYSNSTADNEMLKTGDKIVIDNVEYTIIKRGDVNGDGDISSVDIIILFNYLREKIDLNEYKIGAAKLSKNSDNPSSVDIIMLLNYLRGNIEL